MDTKTFLQTVLGNEGMYCIWAHRIADKRKVQKFYPTIDDAIAAASSLDTNGYDAYFALGTFNDASSREAVNVKQVRALFLDLDCGDSAKKYPDQVTALSALRAFCKSAALPRPTIVNSGRGIHVYWALTMPVSKEEWQPVADAFKAMCMAHGVKIDPVVTADAARVLRVPGTHNHKGEPPLDVHVIGSFGEPTDVQKFVEITAKYKKSVTSVTLSPGGLFSDAPRPPYVPRAMDAMMQALVGNYTSRFKTIMLKTVAGKGCAQLAEVVTNQAEVDEPLWRAGLSIAKFCVDGDKAIHKISEKHPEYDPETTSQKADRIQGPYLCERFDEYRPGVCPNCSHFGKIKSPISLGREVVEAAPDDNVVMQTPIGVTAAVPVQYVIPQYPNPYFRGKNGGVFLRGKQTFDEDGELDEEKSKDRMIYINDVYVVRRLKDPELGEVLVMRLHLPKDGVREFSIPLASVGTKDDFRKHLAMHGVAVINVSELMEYTMRWVTELQFSAEAEDAPRQFGWTNDRYDSFTMGNMIVYADRVEVNAPSGATVGLFPIFQTKGTLDGWKRTMEFYNRPGMEAHKFMVGLSFGAVLMEFQPINAAAFHLYSKESGLGKTTGMLAGAAVWGNPDMMVMQERDTFNSKMNRAEIYKNLPCYMDEMTNTKPQDLSDWAYQLPSGMQRNRMGAKGNVERARGKPWKTLFGTTGNTSIIERIGLYKSLPKAEAQRILECRATPLQFATKSETDEFAASIKENYGHAAIPFVQYVISNLDSVRQLLETTQQKIDTAAGLTAENRFWSALVSRDIAGLVIAKKAGLLDWEIAPIVKWAIDLMKSQRNMVSEMSTDVETILTEYLAENYTNMLRIKSTDDARKVEPTLDKIVPPEAVPGRQLLVRYEYDTKRLFLLPKPLKEWCIKQQIEYNGFIQGLRDGRTKAQRQKVRLSKGTFMNLPPTDVWVLDCTEFMDEETEQTLATTAVMFQRQTVAN